MWWKKKNKEDYPNLIYAITHPKEFYEKVIEAREKYGGAEASTLIIEKAED